MSWCDGVARVLLLFWWCVPCLGQAQSGAKCLKYGPSTVQLTGTIVRETFPGPPKYEGIRKGDRPETYWLLDLPQPICVDEDKTEPESSPAQTGIRRIQLVLDPKAYKKYKGLVGKRVFAEGTLYAGINIHHRTPVLLTVQILTIAK